MTLGLNWAKILPASLAAPREQTMLDFKKIRKNFPRALAVVQTKRKIYTNKTLSYVRRYPYRAFAATLFAFLLIMILGNLFFAPKPVPENKIVAAKEVHIYKIGSAPQILFQGKVEKAGVVKIVAQAPGIVQNINVFEGEDVAKGTNILSLATNYSGGNVLSIARQIAGVQLKNANNTYDLQSDTIAKQREVAAKNKTNSDAMRQITIQSASDTQALLDLQTTIVNGINASIINLEQTNVGGINDAAILQSKELLAQYQAVMVQTRVSFGNLQIQANQISADSADLQYQIALKQLDLQEKNLKMGLKLAGLQYNMAQVNEATMFPSSPFAGVVDKIFVHVGDNVNPGTLLAQISGISETAEIVVSVPQDIARNISRFEPSVLYIGGKSINVLPTYISQNATNGILYAVIYDLDESLVLQLTDNAYIEVKVPIGTANTTNLDPYVPLDSVSQTQEEAFVYIVDDKNIARAKKVNLGQIQGRYVQILDGLFDNASVILERNVVDGDNIKIVE